MTFPGALGRPPHRFAAHQTTVVRDYPAHKATPGRKSLYHYGSQVANARALGGAAAASDRVLLMSVLGLLMSVAEAGQWLPVDPRIEESEPLAVTYPGEVCSWYDVRRLLWKPHACAAGAVCENDVALWPRLGEVFMRTAHLPNASVCDGYGVRHVRRKCTSCPGDPFSKPEWSVLQCASVPLTPRPSPSGAASPTIDVLLVASDHNNHGLFGQVERVLNQLHLAGSRGLTPFVFLGRKVVASADSCEIGENQYYDPTAGDNVWEYYFEQVSDYRLGAASLHSRPVRLLFAAVHDTRRHAIAHSGDAVASYFEFQRFDENLHTIRTRVRRMAADLVRRWVRVRAPLRQAAHALLLPWRKRSSHILGVHFRGTDKVTHPRIPLAVFFSKIDQYLAAHTDALVLLCTDDAKDYAAFAARYGAKLVSRGSGYATRNVVRDPSLPRFRKGAEALIDALLLAHSDFLLKGTSSLAEFAIWYNAHLIEAHLDLQLAGAALSSSAYTSRLPTWFGGPRRVAELSAEGRDASLRELAAPAAAIAPAASVVEGSETKQLARRRKNGKGSSGRWAGTTDHKAGRGRKNGRRARGWRALKDTAARSRARNTPVPDWPRQLSFDPHFGVRPAVAGHVDVSLSAPIRLLRPMPVTRSPAQISSGKGPLRTIAIGSGQCRSISSGRGRLMTPVECADHAKAEGLTFIGSNAEPAEYPGCIRWESGHVEYNDHSDESDGCRLGRTALCVCAVE